MEVKVEYLPLGTIVRLKNGTKRLMIFGRCLKKEETNQEFDYIGCLYPEGYIDQEKTYVFQHDSIEEVIHLGFIDEEEAFVQDLLSKHRPLQFTQSS